MINGPAGVAPKKSGVVVTRRKAVEGAEAMIITMSMKVSGKDGNNRMSTFLSLSRNRVGGC